MITRNNYLILLATTIFMVACGEGGKSIDDKKTELTELRTQLSDLKNKIATLEEEISNEDSSFQESAERNAALVSTINMKKQRFDHAIEVRGSVESRKNISMSAEMGGTVEEIKVREGQAVKEGDLLIRLDVSIMSNQIKEAKTSLELAKTVYERQSKLWADKIGSEIQYLESKNNYESLQTRLNTLQAQYEKNVIRAPFNGVVDEITAKVGQMAAPGIPLIRMVNPGDVYIKADVSESLSGKIEKGDSVKVFIPSIEKTINSIVVSVGQSIKATNRTFAIEVKIPQNSKEIIPNMLVMLSLVDYKTNSALVVPTRVVMEDLKGHYVFLTKTEGSHIIADKQYVKLGQTSNNQTEILGGLSEGDVVVDKGSLLIAQGSMIKIHEN